MRRYGFAQLTIGGRAVPVRHFWPVFRKSGSGSGETNKVYSLLFNMSQLRPCFGNFNQELVETVEQVWPRPFFSSPEHIEYDFGLAAPSLVAISWGLHTFILRNLSTTISSFYGISFFSLLQRICDQICLSDIEFYKHPQRVLRSRHEVRGQFGQPGPDLFPHRPIHRLRSHLTLKGDRHLRTMLRAVQRRHQQV